VIIDHVKDRRRKPRDTKKDERKLKPALIAALAVLFVGGGAAAALKPWQRMTGLPADALGSDTGTMRLAAVLPADSAKPASPAPAPAPGPAPAPAPAPPPAAAPTAADPRPAGTATIQIGSRPMSAIFVNGQAQRSNPTPLIRVPAGLVRITFEVTDTTGAGWSVDSTMLVQADSTYRRVFQLRRP